MSKSTFILFLPLLIACVDSLSTRSALQTTQAAPPYAAQVQALPYSVQPGGPLGVSYTTIVEVLRQPILFEGQRVRLKGKVGLVRDPHRSPTPTQKDVFMLMDSAGRAVKVETTESAVVREGQEVTVEGTLSLPDLSTSSSRTVAITEARIVSSSSGRKKENPSPSAMPASREPRQQPPPSVQPPQKSPSSEGRIF